LTIDNFFVGLGPEAPNCSICLSLPSFAGGIPGVASGLPLGFQGGFPLTVEAARLDRLEREPNLGVIVSLVGATISSRHDPS
jgi:hypothetical protein